MRIARDRWPRHELNIADAGYPAHLRDAPSPPKSLYAIGDVGKLGGGVAVVGARRATCYGLRTSALIAGWLAERGITVISGGAVGCDQAAHRACVDAGTRTVVVMAGGADVLYPSNSGPLISEALACGGAVVSEHPWGTEPRRWAFRTRNRIIAALADVLVVTEAALPSGTFTTAEYALEAGRTVCAVPGSIFAPECRGSNRLIASGAAPITGLDDLAMVLGLSHLDVQEPPRPQQPHDHGQAELLRHLTSDPMRPDDLAFRLDLDVVTVMRQLGALERAGLVSRYPAGRYGIGRAFESYNARVPNQEGVACPSFTIESP